MEEFPKLVSVEQNKDIIRIPSIEEVKVVVIGLNRISAGGPYGITRAFF